MLQKQRGLCICLSVVTLCMNHATTDEPIKVKFGVWTRMRPRNDMLVYVMGNTAISAVPSTGADATMHPDTDRGGVRVTVDMPWHNR